MKAPRDVPNALLESLKSLGLTKYEALVYIGLLRTSGATATEVHEISGVPRASVYPVLDRLVQKELVSVSHTTPKRFDAVAPDQGVENLMRRIESDAESARAALDVFYREKGLEGRGDRELVWTIYGEENIRTRLAGMFGSAERSVEVLATWDILQGGVLPLLESAPDSVPVDIVTERWEGEQPSRFRLHLLPLAGLRETRLPTENLLPYERSGVFLVDDSRALLWMGAVDGQPSALYSESEGLVLFVRRHITTVTEWAKAAVQ
ncbi:MULTISPECIES: TrmB family transcriptional regulator [Methanoculleus]|uniref:Transcriptional regulator, TrmB n=2 Tax=Methanoculleus TaxID=45989 RepID=A3CSS0_METMJ|nr:MULTISPECIES: helix-turn-helix domain-containing protein [Methanoculleus]ABN56420.1 transcriptional regulator, TrmB [Methanoculleus marisnigri JR1]MCC7554999.1 TrmB family transcriptional regulator [Methanoculleus marisnigri]UYU17867.1 TrmB family transcriptional regulator [Methanoculleus submarinus]